MSRKKSNNKGFHKFLFVVYVGLMVWLLFCRPRAHSDDMTYRELLRSNINLSPFLTIKNYYWVIRHSADRALVQHCTINLVGNVVLFVPPGWLLPDIWRRNRNFFIFFFNCLATIMLIELTQLFTLLGSFDVDDILLNLFGMVLGFWVRLLFVSRKK